MNFPEILDLTPYTTSGSLSTVPTSSISTPSPPPTPHEPSSSTSSEVSSHPRRSTTPTPETYAPGAQRTIYRLAAVVCHYGQHSFGHYICYRRKPKRLNGKWVPPTLVDPLRLETDETEDTDAQPPTPAAGTSTKPNGSAAPQQPPQPHYAGSSILGETRYYWEDRTEAAAGTGRGWLRISDDAVSECGVESVLAEGGGAFMLYYERAVHPRPGVYMRGRGAHVAPGEAMRLGGRSRSRSRSVRRGGGAREADGEGAADTDTDRFSIGSEETLRPEMRVVDLHGSVGSLVSEVGVGIMKTPKKSKTKAERAKTQGGSGAAPGAMSMSMSAHLPLSASSSVSSTHFGPRVVRSVNARRRLTPDVSAPVGIESAPSVGNPVYTNGAAVHAEGGILEDNLPSHMTASAPTILASAGPAKSLPNGDAKAHVSSPLGLGSKTTKIMHQPYHSSTAANVQVKAR